MDSIFYWICQSAGDITDANPAGYTELKDGIPSVYRKAVIDDDP